MIGEPLACAFNPLSISVLGVYVRARIPPEGLHKLVGALFLIIRIFLIKVLAENNYVLLANTARYFSWYDLRTANAVQCLIDRLHFRHFCHWDRF